MPKNDEQQESRKRPFEQMKMATDLCKFKMGRGQLAKENVWIFISRYLMDF